MPNKVCIWHTSRDLLSGSSSFTTPSSKASLMIRDAIADFDLLF